MQVMVEEVSFFSYRKYEAYQYRPVASRQRKNEHWQITEGIRRSSPHYSWSMVEISSVGLERWEYDVEKRRKRETTKTLKFNKNFARSVFFKGPLTKNYKEFLIRFLYKSLTQT